LAFILSTNVNAQESPRDEYDTFARFGNYDDFTEYVCEHVKKPEPITADAKGIIAITVLIDTAGNASVFKIGKKISPDVDAEFTKAVLSSPKWKPATLHGKHVQVYFTIQIGIDLNKSTGTLTTDTSIGRIYNAVEINPSFPGGEKAMAEFIDKTMRYPAMAKQNNTQGRVFIQFVVETDGSLSDLKILRDPGNGLGDETIRIFKQSPKWIPGMRKGKVVRVQFTEPVNFTL
jgi:TonB family protein